MSWQDEADFRESQAGDQLDQYRPLTQPLAIHLSDRSGDERYILTAVAADSGALRINMTVKGHGTSHALSNLQSRAVCPTVVRPGWQEDLITFAAAGIYHLRNVEWGVAP